jgi:predicted AlkP superfamily phosphohydrolase/phosphomutase
MTAPKVIVVGLDSMPPELALAQYKEQMPFLNAMAKRGMAGVLASTDPPVTVPAWVSMTSGKKPGKLGLYGFGQYAGYQLETRVVAAGDVKEQRIWQVLEANGESSVVVSVPVTYGMAQSPHTAMTTGFLTPAGASRFASGPRLQRELTAQFGNYIVDVSDFRHKNAATVLEECQQLSRQHFEIFRHLILTKQPRFAMMVDMGPDRFHHAALRHVDARHPAYEPGNMGKQYYAALDAQIEQTFALADADTLCLIVSDHGVKPLGGAFCLNEFLIQSGHLVLSKGYPNSVEKLSNEQVDWARTRAFAFGGYHGKIFLNRHANWKSEAAKQHTLVEIADALMCHPDAPNTVAYTASALYGDYRGTPPDLTVYFDNFNLRAAGTIGHRTLRIPTNDTGFDDANHQPEGLLVAAGPGITPQQKTQHHICDVFPSVLTHLNLPLPADLDGTSFI